MTGIGNGAAAADYYAGLDLGQASDPSALSILETTKRPLGDPLISSPVNHHVVRYLYRWPLGTPYPRIVDDVARLFLRPPLPDCPLIVDYTGVGRPVFDMFHARSDLRAQVIPLTFSGSQMGMKAHYTKGVGWVVPKRDLAGAVQAALGGRRLQVANLAERETLVKELRVFSVKVNKRTGNESYEAFRERDHDDLVFAVAMPLWFADWVGKRARGIRTYRVGGKKKMLTRLVVCTHRELKILDVQDHPSLLVFLSDPRPADDNKVRQEAGPGAGMGADEEERPAHPILKVQGELDLRFAALEPADHRETWTRPLDRYGGLTIEQASMKQADGKKLWSFLLRKREPRSEVYVIVDDEIKRGLSVAMGVCDALRLPRGAIWVPGQPDRMIADKEEPPIPHVWEQTRAARVLIVAGG